MIDKVPITCPDLVSLTNLSNALFEPLQSVLKSNIENPGVLIST